MKLTFKGRCPRMIVDIPFVGCRCIDCRVIRAKRWIKRKLGLLPKDPQGTLKRPRR